MSLPVRAGFDLIRRCQPIIRPSFVRHVIPGRSRNETPQAMPDGSIDLRWSTGRSFVSLDWGTAKPLDKEVIATPIKRDEKRVGVPEEVKGKEMEILWPTEREVQEGEYHKPQWERKQINVQIHSSSRLSHSPLLFSTFGMATIFVINFVMKWKWNNECSP